MSINKFLVGFSGLIMILAHFAQAGGGGQPAFRVAGRPVTTRFFTADEKKTREYLDPDASEQMVHIAEDPIRTSREGKFGNPVSPPSDVGFGFISKGNTHFRGLTTNPMLLRCAIDTMIMVQEITQNSLAISSSLSDITELNVFLEPDAVLKLQTQKVEYVPAAKKVGMALNVRVSYVAPESICGANRVLLKRQIEKI